jgi:diguanylate cyclase (GGDEF)-like protein/PAS domain S-box-containing protein
MVTRRGPRCGFHRRLASRSVVLGLGTGWLGALAVAPVCLGVGLACGWALRARRGADPSRAHPPPADRRFHLLADAAPLAIFELDPTGRVTYANPQWQRLGGAGATPEGASADVWAAVHPDDRAAMAGRWAKALRDGTAFRARFRILDPDGHVCWVLGQTSPVRHPSGVPVGHVGTVLEVTDLVEARQNLLRFHAIIESTTDYVGVVDGTGRLVYLNQAARETLGLDGDTDLATVDVRAFYTSESWQVVESSVLPAVSRGEVWRGELALRTPGRRDPVPVSNVVLAHRSPTGEVEFVASIARDTSEQKQLEARLHHQAEHDQLTGLPNRAPLLDWLGEALQAPPARGSVAVLFLDIDRFKVVNDSLGHEAGDRLLVSVARRLSSSTRPQDRVARFGGDEFVVVCVGVGDQHTALELADRVRREVGGRFALGDDEVFVTVSIGVALGAPGASAEELLRDADAAMYEAKALGRDRVQLFDIDVRERVVERLDVEQALRYALERDEVCLVYQPIIDLATGGVRGAEALVRWRHPERGLLLPAQFLRVAEETGYIVELGRWILTTACQVAREVLVDPSTGEPLPLFVNLSPRQLADDRLVSMVREVVHATGIEPGVLHFEITENALMADAETTSSTLRALRELGVRLALDDFGTGHSSLAYLKTFPVEVLKIDRTFIEGLGRDAGDQAITGAIVNVARMLGLSTVAEGVETPDQAAALAALGCDLGQGYHFARPMDAAALAELIGPAEIDLTGP